MPGNKPQKKRRYNPANVNPAGTKITHAMQASNLGLSHGHGGTISEYYTDKTKERNLRIIAERKAKKK